MKRVSIGVIAALVLLYPVTAWLMGFAIEKRFEAAIGELHEKAPYLAMTEHHFQRGWYTSQDDMTLELPQSVLGAVPGAAAASPARFLITIHSVFHHGPICGWTCLGLARADSHVAIGGPLQSAVAGLFGSAEPLRIRSRLGFFGGGSAQISSPAFEEAALRDGTHVGWGGLEAAVTYGAGMNSYAAHLAAPRVMYSTQDGKRFEVTATEFDSSSKRVLRTLYAGDSTFTIGRVALVGAAGAGTVTVDTVRALGSSRVDEGFMTVSAKTSIGAITSAPVTLTGAHFDIAFRHLELESLEALTSEMQQVNGRVGLAPAARSAELLSVLKQQGAPLLARQPELAIDRISFANAKGEAVLKGLVRLAGVTSADFADGADARVFLAKLDMDLDLTLDDALLQSLPGGPNSAKQLQSLADQGLFTHDNGKFHTAILFRHGQMTFNGKPFQPGIAPPASPTPPASPPLPPPASPRVSPPPPPPHASRP
ncbi:MAG TPA: YdgA family protein [Steroidobacteraceae bacterium]|nr:YdgA family protein [Steroidobacteraceae bacterium]